MIVDSPSGRKLQCLHTDPNSISRQLPVNLGLKVSTRSPPHGCGATLLAYRPPKAFTLCYLVRNIER
ncbi:hypothetical protein M3J09_002112 [Ascochyta lentis]